ncbi:MAG: hypothetical protein QGH99_10150 [Pseudomonadales bacterium]|jgi:tRNA (pseudouridine54-N1)-methyltransferase|nr:tRNA (pseudouridine(54)-N(1))-methyltransferase TrmY [Gammaproteobacteria bacterium]MDP6027146.1 hypothetical protein [Pseudomonadales bacterium]MDP6314620.1 hypothetical protein [Pseudomonadales bacterium]MDP7313399.1 hypothetical protein [Pseudomonadales bacterium]MDP7577316.1 hypothetical protein [Pseudomonadales bacterium]|tara:strand:- start:1498 stop:2127 length:630 start_codon:yes stop_codon:yes gene_type:complete
MPEFIVRARKAPVDADRFLTAVGEDAHVEYLSQIIVNSLFISKGHRNDTTLTLVLEDSSDFSRAISLAGATLGSVEDVTEMGFLKLLADCLRAGASLKKEETKQLDNGIQIQAVSFEHLVRDRAEQRSVYILDKKGQDIRSAEVSNDAVFLLTDHIPMPKKTFKSMQRQGVQKLSLGPVMLHASQCIVLIQNEIDRHSMSTIIGADIAR